jgi:hypothetical protein
MLGNLEVEREYITLIVFVIGLRPVRFQLVAPEESGQNLERQLRKLEKDGIIKFSAEDYEGRSLAGLCKIVSLEISKDSTNAPTLYRFSGELEQVT